MATSTLWVRVISATLEETGEYDFGWCFGKHDPGAVQVTARVGSSGQSTRKQPSPSPLWDEKFMFTVSNMSGYLTLELHQIQFLFSKKLLGMASIPLYSIRHSTKDSEGHWIFLFLQNSSGELVPTQHQLHLDAHFELPRDLPTDLLEALDRKLSKLDEVLEKEVEVIESQQQRMITGDLTPPSTDMVSYSYPTSPSTTPSPSQLRAASTPTPPIITVTSPMTAPLTALPEAPMTPRSSQSYDKPADIEFSPMIRRSPEAGRKYRHRKSPFSEQEAPIVLSETRSTRNRWKEILQNPVFQQKLSSLRAQQDCTGKSSGIFTLAQIVDQLKQQKSAGNIKSFISVNADFLTRSHSVIKSKRKHVKGSHLMDEDMRIHVYKRAVEALVYPASDPDAHHFEKWTAHRPTNCSECNSLLWGLAKQGVKCTRCGKICHERCATIASQECFQIHDQHSSTVDLYLAAISDKMHRTVINHATMFKTLREAFSVSAEDNDIITEEIKRKILDLAQDFSAIVKVKVIAAQGLNITKDRGVYVSVAVGHGKKRTKTFKGDGIPYWNEEFSFSCFNYHEPIQIRVWNERDTPLAKVAHKLTKEGDIFLGEKVIEVRRVGAPRDVWYKLEKRTTDSQVSGSINVNLSARVDNDVIMAPFHDQYMRLHEQMFVYVHLTQSQPLLLISPEPDKEDDDNKVKFLPKVAQEIIDEFALRYAVEPIFRMMVHHQLLVKYHHSLNGALRVMDNLLRSLRYQMFTVVAADNAVRAVGATKLLEEHFDSSNFGRDNFAGLLDKLLSSLRLDLQQYRELYPANDENKLQELVDACQLMGTVLEFQQQAMGILTTGKLSDMIVESMKECLKSTFELIISNCVPEDFTGEGHPALVKTETPFQFFNQLMEQIQSAVNDDRIVYAPLISRFCSDNFGDTSSMEMWSMFSSTIENLFDEPANLELFPPNAYIHLLYAVKRFYNFLLADVSGHASTVPKYHQWFIPCVRHWLQEYQQGALVFVNNAWEDDKQNDKFAPHQHQPYSNSVYQMFFFLNKGYELLKSLHTPDGVPMDEDAKHVHFHDFSDVVCSVVGQYVDKVSVHLPDSVEELEQACMLLNNLHALRVHTQGLFEDMGGEENIGPAASEALSDFQANVLAKELLSWCVFVARSLTSEILHAVGMLQSELLRLKGQGGVDKNDVRVIAGPLMDMLTKRARTFAENCETVVLQKVIKEVWYVVLESLHRMLLPMLQWDKEGVQAVSSDFPAHNYTNRQCTALETMLEILRDFFAEGGQVQIRLATLDRGIKQLKGVIYLYRQTTEMLISDYIADSNATSQSTDASCGEVSMEIDAYHHPATGELEGTIRVLSAINLKPFHGGVRNMRPYIELNLVVPQATPPIHKRRFITSHRSGTLSPNFNQSFKFILNTWEERCELQVSAKHHGSTFGLGSDKVIGVAVVPLATVLKEASVTLGLSPCLPCSDQGQALLNVLSVRTNDEHAKEFVALKQQQRDSKEQYV